MIRIAAPMLLVLAGCSGASNQPSPPDPVALVTLARVAPAPLQESVEIFGTADPGVAGSVILSAPEEAVVTAVDVSVGSPVGRGQTIVRLTPSATSRLDWTKSRSDAQAAQLAYARARRLRADGLVGNAEVEAARAAAQSATATTASLAARGGKLTLQAPAAGFVESIAASAGSLVASGTPIVTIARAGDLRARFGVDPALARRVQPQSAMRIAPSGGGPAFTVPVLSIDPNVDPQTRLASIYVRLPAAARIGVGEPLTGQVAVSGAGSAPTVPYAALLDEGGQPYVFVVAGGTARRRDVVLGPVTGDRVAILRGLKSGELVVTQGGTALADGTKVRTR